jgi:hypothetical protein
MSSLGGAGNTPLHLAMEYNYKEIADYLTKKGADITIRNKKVPHDSPAPFGFLDALWSKLWLFTCHRGARRMRWKGWRTLTPMIRNLLRMLSEEVVAVEYNHKVKEVAILFFGTRVYALVPGSLC